MVEYFVTKGKLVVRNNEPFVVTGGEEKTIVLEAIVNLYLKKQIIFE